VPPAPDFFPSASLETLKLRARLLAAVRSFFEARGYWEVDTPCLSHDCVIDPNLAPFVARWHPAGFPSSDAPADSQLVYLQTSPEFAMKRLIVAGAQAIYQLGHVFRNGEFGRWHSPEYTMIEWYRVGDTHREQMQVVEDLVNSVWQAARTAPRLQWSTPFLRTTYRDAFHRHTGADVVGMTTAEIAEFARQRLDAIPESMSPDDRDGWLNLLLAELVEPNLGQARPEFLLDYPASQCAIARIREESPPVAERFELYIQGVEICNGYHELTDSQELASRMEAETARRQVLGQPPLPVSNRLLEAMQHGLPACAGVALGFDRLMMLACDKQSLAEVLPFAFDRA
jgi:lysyl-tRNA synthetase class 2